MAIIAASLVLAASAGAAAPEFVLRMPDGDGIPGSGAGQLDHPRGVVANPVTGHVYVSEFNNARISEYTAWGNFVKAWGWGVADGATELQTCGPATPEATPPAGLCQIGSEGSGAGQLARPIGIAVDPAGDVYVLELNNLRVQKFSPEGEFLLMFGGEVNKTKVEEGAPATEQNVCPVAEGDICQAGTAGEAPSHLAGTLGNYIAYSASAGAIVVGDKGRIQQFNLDGSFKAQIPFEGELEAFKGKSVTALDTDATGNLYIALGNTEDIYKLSGVGEALVPGKPLASGFKVKDPTGAVTVDSAGNVYAVDDPFGFGGKGNVLESKILEFDPTASKLVPTAEEEEEGFFFPGVPFNGPVLTGLGTNICAGSEAPGNLYAASFRFGQVSDVDAYGSGPVGCEAPPERPPVIVTEYATSVGSKEATLRAEINPRFWQDATYQVQWGVGKCSEGGCGEETPEAKLTSKAINRVVRSAGVFLADLQPGTTYHYRFVAQSSGGGPVVGEERSFTTFAAPTAGPKCANEELRSGASAKLPDCRAYEMVSPIDKENGDAALVSLKQSRFKEINQSATSGERFTYSSISAFADPKAAPYISQYLAGRDPEEGWSSEAISPPRSALPLDILAEGLTNEFKGFSADLCSAWLRHNSVATLGAGAIAGFPNLYRRENCSEPRSYEALTTVEPPNRAPEKYFELTVQGFSADGAHSIFTAADKLSADAPILPEALEEPLLYEHTPDGLRFVCYLPNGEASPQACGAGMAAGLSGGDQASAHNAISADGSRIFWTAYTGATATKFSTGHPGTIYVRIEGKETVAVSGSVAPDPAFYWTAADDGSKAIFEFDAGPKKDELYEFDVESEVPRLIAKGVEGSMGASEDASRIYLVSSEELAEGASEGDHNLYLYEAGEGGGEGTFTFIMVLTGGEAARLPSERSSTVSPDGGHLAFTSAVSPTPTGYENLDAVSGEPDAEAYLYDAAQDELVCVSCNPTNARPAGENLSGLWAAARIQGWEFAQHTPRVLSDDGRRLFFESHEALVARDTNEAWDVYQWEEAGSGDCDEGDATFGVASEGCVDLISSGESPANSSFLDADPSGANVFIGTLSSLVASDPGLNDVYDARVGGGFPEKVRGIECEGEACQSPPAPPAEVTPASAAFEGPGNPRTSKPKSKHCRRGTRKVRRKGKTRCVKKVERQHKRGHPRGAAR